MKIASFVLGIFILMLCYGQVFAQMERRTVDVDRPLDLVFPTPRHINIPTTEALSSGELYYSIMHTFGRIDSGWRNLWGIDQGANVRFSLEYGFSDTFSAGFGRSSMDRVFDLGLRYHPVKQTVSGSVPISLSIVLNGGITSLDPDLLPDDYSFTDRMSMALSVPVSRRFGSDVSVLAVPMVATFARTNPLLALENQNATEYAGLGLGVRYKFSSNWSVTAQHITRYGIGEGLNLDVLALGVDWETGGHVFQMYFTNTQSIIDPYLLAGRAQDPFDGGFRFGFNINRSFQL